MTSSELTVELGTEEIPAGLLETAATDLARSIAEALSRERLSSRVTHVWYTPRRIIAVLTDIPARQEDLFETILGPPRRAAYDDEGAPTRAALAFAEKNRVALDALETIRQPKGEYVGFVRRVRGEPARAILQRIIPSAVSSLQFPKTMFWSPDRFRFPRPIRWVVALLDGKVVPFGLAEVSAGRFSSGHRFLGKRRIRVDGAESLKERLRENAVLADPDERRERIRLQLKREASALGGQLLPDDDLLETVTNLNEWPSVIGGAFDTRFLALPHEILVTVMREHQKYFSVEGEEGRLLPAFLAVINLQDDSSGAIRAGHERVLRARLADAEFFWSTDRQTKILDLQDRLRSVLFQEKLGSYHDKTARMLALAPRLADMLGCGQHTAELETAIRLSKCDLVTEMVKEFTDLQGIVGGLYAREEGYPEEVWRAVYEQYQPRSMQADSPSSLLGGALALIDRLDSVCGCISVGLIPTGSRDPFAVRRQGNGILKIIFDRRLSVSLDKLCRWSLEAFGDVSGDTVAEIRRFLEGRLRFLLEDAGYPYDCINAAVSIGCDDPLDTLERVRALQAMRDHADFLALASSFKRVVNILSQAGKVRDEPQRALMEDDAELSLWDCYRDLVPRIAAARAGHDYESALRLMASMRPVVDRFFDRVLVMAKDEALRNNRLALLSCLADMFLGIADISQMVIEANT